MNTEESRICYFSADANEDLGVPHLILLIMKKARGVKQTQVHLGPLGELGGQKSIYSAEIMATDKMLVSGGCYVKILELLCAMVNILCQRH